jgi:hypothetical protein
VLNKHSMRHSIPAHNNFEPERTTGKSNINHLERRFNLVHCRPTQVLVNIAYAHLHHHNTKSYMPTKNESTTTATISTTKMEKGMPTWTSNQRMNNWVTLTKTMQSKAFKHWISIPLLILLAIRFRFSNWQETRPLLILWVIRFRISNWQETRPLLILWAIRFRFSNWQETRPLLILWAIRISNWQKTPPLLILLAIRFQFRIGMRRRQGYYSRLK